MEAGIRAFALAGCLALSACQGVGFTELNTHSFWNNQTAEEKQDGIWWDRYYGQRGLPVESKAWKDFYKPTTGQEVPKPDYCGYWGNCPNSEVSETSSCAFYGNCAK
ncbi:MAG: hypothetical protein WDN72_04205 [Alphaproteobacteria bacterium]